MRSYFVQQLLKTLTIALLCFAFTNAAYSQAEAKQKATPEQRATRLTDRMKSNLNLTDDQYKRVYQLNLAKAKAHEAAKPAAEARKQEKEKYQADLKAILSPEQYAKMKEMRKEKRGHKEAKVPKAGRKAPERK